MPDTERGEPERNILAQSEQLIGELETANMVLISTPMHNYTVPATLKT
jgi:FMN-dependent NADH-azoreductase